MGIFDKIKGLTQKTPISTEDMINKIAEVTGRSKEDSSKINDILNENFIVGRNQKDKIVEAICSKLNIGAEEADKIYNQCAEFLVKSVFKK